MNKRLKRIFIYAGMSILYFVLGYMVLYIAGEPIADYVIASGKMVIVKGAPGYLNQSDPEVAQLVMSKKAVVTTKESEVVVPKPGSHYGDMVCERVDLAAPIYFSDSDEAFENGVGQYPKSGLPGEGKPIVIGGHDETFFAPLEHIRSGDIIKISTEYGAFEYEVTGTRVAEAKDTTAYDLSQHKEQLILYTCYPFGQLVGDDSNRFYVYCDRIMKSGQAAE